MCANTLTAIAAISNLIIAIASVFTARTAYVLGRKSLMETLRQQEVQREHNRKSVEPHLVFTRVFWTISQTPKFEIVVKNTGLGPALIKEVQYYVDNNKPWDMSEKRLWEGILKSVGINKDMVGENLFETNMGKQYGISAGDSVTIVHLDLSESVKVEEIRNCVDHIDIWIQYDSFYGESFERRLSDDLSKPQGKG